MAKVLIVEDDHSTVNVLKDILEAEQHTVESASNGADAMFLLDNYQFDLAIVDWELPDAAGVDIIKRSRERGVSLKFLILTGRGDSSDKIKGLDSGSDDYMTKPFDKGELMARVRALLRRPNDVQGNELKAGNLTLNTVSHQVQVGDQEVDLLPKEYSLLEFFLRHPNQVFSIEAILERVWKSESDSSESAVRTCVTRLRKKIESEDGPQIVSVHGFGYKMTLSKK